MLAKTDLGDHVDGDHGVGVDIRIGRGTRHSCSHATVLGRTLTITKKLIVEGLGLAVLVRGGRQVAGEGGDLRPNLSFQEWVTDDAEVDEGETIVIDAASTYPALTLTMDNNDVAPVPALRAVLPHGKNKDGSDPGSLAASVTRRAGRGRKAPVFAGVVPHFPRPPLLPVQSRWSVR